MLTGDQQFSASADSLEILQGTLLLASLRVDHPGRRTIRRFLPSLTPTTASTQYGPNLVRGQPVPIHIGGTTTVKGLAKDFKGNTQSIYRGVEGSWFRSSTRWEELVRPRIDEALTPAPGTYGGYPYQQPIYTARRTPVGASPGGAPKH